MPHIFISSMSNEEVKQVASLTSSKLAEVIECPEDWIIYYANGSNAYSSDFDLSKVLAFVEVAWFAREKKVEKEVVKILHETLSELGRKETTIVFKELKEETYYEEGVCYKE